MLPLLYTDDVFAFMARRAIASGIASFSMHARMSGITNAESGASLFPVFAFFSDSVSSAQSILLRLFGRMRPVPAAFTSAMSSNQLLKFS